MPELDSLRGLAILLVVAYHSFGFDSRLMGIHGLPKLFVAAALQGWAGVNVFFALSGFLITGILLESRDNRRYYKRFYWRRAVRILPPYTIILLFFVATYGTTLIEHHCSWTFLTCAAFYVANLSPLFGSEMGYGCLWSLAVEEQFYLAWPALVRHLSQAALVRAALFIIVAAPACRAFAFARHLHYTAPYTWFVADGLAMGAIFAVVARSKSRDAVRRLVISVGGLSVVMLCAGAPFGILTLDRVLGGVLRLTVVNLFSTALLGTVVLIGTGPNRRFVRIRPLAFFGQISYGLYLYHILVFDICDSTLRRIWPAMPSPERNFPVMAIRFLAWGAVSVALSTLSRRTFEERFLRLKARLAL